MRDRAIDTRNHRGLTVSLHHDQDCESPRENDNLGTIITWSRRYDLSDKDAPKHLEPEDFNPKDYAICLPVFLFEHSGVALSTGDFGDRWDSGQVGWIYVTREKLLREYSCKRLTAKTIEKATGVLKAEIGEYSKYVNGECYGYVVTDEDEPDEPLDSCWGFIGDEYAWEAAIEAADSVADARTAKADAIVDAQRSEN